MSWQICRKVVNAWLDPAYQIENKFWNLKAGSLQVGITNEKLEKVICSRGSEAFLIKGFYEQTMLSLHKKIQSNWKGYANMRVPIKVLRLLPWTKTTIVILQIPSEWSERGKKSQQHFVSFSPEVGLIVKFYESF